MSLTKVTGRNIATLACLLCMVKVATASTCAYGNAMCYRDTCCGQMAFCNGRTEGPGASHANPYPQCCSSDVNGVTICVDVATGSASGNPHFKGFDGTHFDFFGYPGGAFNFLTERDHQVNVVLDDFGVEGQTYISSVGIKYKNILKVLAASNPYRVGGLFFTADNMTVELNDRLVRQTHDFIAVDDFEVDIRREEAQDLLFVSTPLFAITVTKQRNHLRLDLSVQVRGPVTRPVHGVLGQTVSWAANPSSVMKRTMADEFSFEVSGPFQDDGLYNLFAYKDQTQEHSPLAAVES